MPYTPAVNVAPVILIGRNVRLTPLRPEHAPGLLAAATPELFRFTPQGPAEWSEEGFRQNIAKISAVPDLVPFAVIHRPTERVIGRTTYMEIRPTHRGLEIGNTWISAPHQGTVVNPEMKYLMMRHAFETLGAIRVQYKTGHNNLHSQAAIAKLGAAREGVLRNHMVLPDGTFRHTVVFGITVEDWPETKARLEDRLGYVP